MRADDPARLRHPVARRSLAVLATGLAVAASVLIGPGGAYAAPTPSAPPQPSAAPAPSPSPIGSTAPSTPPSPSGSPSAQPTASPTVAPAASCGGGALAFGQIVHCPAINGADKHVYTFTTTRKSDTVYTVLTRGSGDLIVGGISGPGGIGCGISYAGSCQLGRAGTYTITVELAHGQGTGDYALSVDSLLTPSSCTALPNSFFSFASAGLPGVLAYGSAGHCFRFNQPAGTVVRVVAPSTVAGDVRGMILDAQHQPVCPVQDTRECTLTSAGPYRLFLQEFYGNEGPYTLRLARLSGAAGCPLLRTGTFGGDSAAIGTGSLSATTRFTCHRLHASAAGTVALRVDPEQSIDWTVFDGAGQRLCERWVNFRHCVLPAAGDYTLLMDNASDWGDPFDYQVAAVALHRGAGCAPVTGMAWDTPTLAVRQTSPVQVDCHPFRGTAGDRVEVFADPREFNEVYTFLVDVAGTMICTGYSEQDGCVLPATGTYRAVSYLSNWTTETGEATYDLQVRRLSNPAGCPVAGVAAYGTAPVLGPVRCRVVDVPAAGRYLLKAVDAAGWSGGVQLYDQAGLKACAWGGCDFTGPGRYTAVVRSYGNNEIIQDDHEFAFSLLAEVPSGCPQVSDAAGPPAVHRGGFTGVGQVNCLELAGPAGSHVLQLLPGDAVGAARPAVHVVDATGVYVCDSSSLRQYSCELTGTAPFYAVLALPDGQTSGEYATAFPRPDGPPACPVLPRTAEGTTVTSSADSFGFCFSVPAEGHAARETFTYRRTSGGGDASLWIFDGTGIRYCGSFGPSIDRTLTCTLPAGPATVFLEADAVDATWQLTHRDGTVPAA